MCCGLKLMMMANASDQSAAVTTADAGGAAGERRRDLRRALPHLHGTSSQAAVVGLPEEAFVSVAARPRSRPALARLAARSHDAGDGDRRSRRRPPLGAGGDSLFVAPAATLVVGVAVSAFSGKHARLAAAVPMDRAQSIPAERRAEMRRRHVLAARRLGIASHASVQLASRSTRTTALSSGTRRRALRRGIA